MTEIVEITPKRHPEAYAPKDWSERDNFVDRDAAVAFGEHKARQYPVTPYRVIRRRGRWSLMFVPEWNLKEAF